MITKIKEWLPFFNTEPVEEKDDDDELIGRDEGHSNSILRVIDRETGEDITSRCMQYMFSNQVIVLRNGNILFPKDYELIKNE